MLFDFQGVFLMSGVHLAISAFKLLCHNARHSVIDVPYAAFLALKRLNDKDTHYLVVCDHIGDLVLTLGYVDSFKKEHGISHITVCTTEKLAGLCNRYKNCCDEIICFDPDRLYKLIALSSTDFGMHILKKLGNITIVNPDNDFLEKQYGYLIRYPDISFYDCIKYGCLSLSGSAIFNAPEAFGANEFPDPGKDPGKKRLLVCPGSRFIEGDISSLLDSVVSKLNESGYEIYTNTVSDDDVIKGTKPYKGSLNELVDFVNSGVDVIGVRSGLFDLLSFCDCRIVAIYPDDKYMNFFDLNRMPKRKAEILQLSSSEKGAAEKIFEFLR